MLSKILFTIAVVVAIWKAFSMISRLTKSAGGVPRPAKPDDRQRAAHPSEPKAVDMKPCSRCGAFVDPREGCRCSASSA